MRKSIPALTLLVTGAAAVGTVAASVPFHGSSSPQTRYSSQGEVAVAGADGRRGYVRTKFVLPATWRRDSSLNAQTLRFDTRNSCHHKVTFTPRMAQGEPQSAEARAAASVPGPSRYLLASGTREGAAFRVVRDPGGSGVTGILVQPLPASSSPGTPESATVYAELRARATADPKLECHSGGPRTVATTIGDAFGAGSAGGFVLHPRP